MDAFFFGKQQDLSTRESDALVKEKFVLTSAFKISETLMRCAKELRFVKYCSHKCSNNKIVKYKSRVKMSYL